MLNRRSFSRSLLQKKSK